MLEGQRDPQAIVERERQIRDQQASLYDAHRRRDEYIRSVEDAAVLDTLGLQEGETVVDAGCGTGLHLPELMSRARLVIGVDHSERSLDVARDRTPPEQRERLRLVAADLREIPLEDGIADRVVSVNVLQHLPTPEYRRRMLSELLRILRPGGLAVVDGYRWLGHIKRRKEGFFDGGLYRYAFTVGELRHLLRDAGFTDVDVGGCVVLPGLARRLHVSVETQVRLCFTPVGRTLAHYVLARARRPA